MVGVLDQARLGAGEGLWLWPWTSTVKWMPPVGGEGLALMLEEFWVGRPKERDEISYEFPRRPAILCIRQRGERCRPRHCFERQAGRVLLRQFSAGTK